ncbi:restriction endonuclease subunit S [Thalassospira lohafexi]|uniref:Restriction endonuclease subunit S n=1 Tax=Thalassospira lohafexi TaxID=744227 RepID=A0A2N3LB28_9PROT|nr:restriction endonuclease subunit S [Thalassospira lohafexi]PKR59937.1 restriction endonuclease subunit S [Thalassospira lohafexi]
MTHEVTEGWQSKPLSDLGEYQNGRAFKPADWGTEGLPIIRIAQINNPYSETNYYSGSDVQEKHLIRDGDLLFSWSATLTALLWKNGDGILNQHIFKVVENEGVDKNFLLYTILHSIDGLASHSHGTTMKHIKKGVLDKYHVGVPPLPEQKKIAEVLSSVDEAIAATKAVIDQTKQVKKGLLQTLLTKGIGHTKFKQTELGEIPESWELKKADDLCMTISVGIVIKPAQYYVEAGSGIKALRSANVREGYIEDDKWVYLSKEGHEKNKKSQLKAGDVLVVRSGYTGTSCVVPPEYNGTNCIDIIFARPKHNLVISEFLSAYINSPEGRKQVLKSEGGLAQKHFNVTELKKMLVPIPPKAEQIEIVRHLEDAQTATRLNEAKLSQLQALKTGLMSDLLTGRKRVEVPNV